jgi:transposase
MKNVSSMKILNANAAGIDVGSKSHYAAVGQNEGEVQEFGVYSSDHQNMIDYFTAHKVETIAMESTGSYWQTLFFALQKAGFEVLLVAGHQTKNLRAKTDVKDCQWIQKLHSLGLVRGCFLPDEQTNRLRVLHRHRSSLVEQSAKMTNKMQKALRMMNLRLDVVLSDITGKSGIAIIEAILMGERKGEVLAQKANSRVRKSKDQIADALQGQWSKEFLYELEDCYDLYKTLQRKIQDCDKKIEALMIEFTQDNIHNQENECLTKKQVKGKNQPRFNLPELSYSYYGVDLFAIEGVSMNTVLTLITELGKGIYKFKTAKQFTSFLRLAPNNRISGGKILSSRTPKGGNRFALSLRNAANTIDRKKEGTLVLFFKRIAYKKGRAAAITATARKLAVIIWNMINKKQPYEPINDFIYSELIKAKTIASMKKRMKKLGIKPQQLMSYETS